MATVTIVSTRDAKNFQKTPLTRTISALDAWGREEQFEVTWLPEVAWGVDGALENVGKVQVVWAEECPVGTRRGHDGSVELVGSTIQVSGGGGAEIFEAHQVKQLDDLEPGRFHVNEISA